MLYNEILIPDKQDVIKEQLQKCFQSFEINFLIGSGASLPAISTANTIEEDLNKLKEKPAEYTENSKVL